MAFAYLAALLVSIFCMTLLDRRFTLFFWRDWRRATVVMAIGVVFFVIWDFAGISLDIFYRGDSPWMTGLEIAPEMPVEELFFLTLLCYVTMVAYGGFDTLLPPSQARSARSARSLARSPQSGSRYSTRDRRLSKRAGAGTRGLSEPATAVLKPGGER